MLSFDNRVTKAAAEMDERIAGLDPEAKARMEEAATLEMRDWLDMGDKPTRALQAGIVTADEAQTLHAIHTDYNHGATLGQKVAFLMCMKEILGTLVGA